MTEQDFTANTFSIGGIVLTLTDFQTGLTILVLLTALALNVVRIIDIKRKQYQARIEKEKETDI